MKLGQFLLTLSAAFFLNACSSEKVQEKATSKEAPVPTAATAEAKAETKPEHKPLPKLAGTDPEKSYSWLKNGNSRYLKGFVRKDGASHKDIERLSAGQKPHSIILSCSDSRVPPELVFDQRLGEIFVVRTAGEVLDPNVIGSIEYAVEHLGSRLIVVMGHTSCGAVKAAIAALKDGSTGSPNIDSIIKDIQPRITKVASSHEPAKNVIDESWANTRGVAHDLMERSKIIEEFVKDGQLQIKTALYNIETGKVDFE